MLKKIWLDPFAALSILVFCAGVLAFFAAGCGGGGAANVANDAPIKNEAAESPAWDSEPIETGDGYIVLRWEPIDDPNLNGYVVYRNFSVEASERSVLGESQSSFTTVLVNFEDLDDEPSNPNCPKFSKSDPGYCDVGISDEVLYVYAIAVLNRDGSVGKKSEAKKVVVNGRMELLGPGSLTGLQPGSEIRISSVNTLFFWEPFYGADQYELTMRDEETDEIFWQILTEQTSIKYTGPSWKECKNGASNGYEWKVAAKSGSQILAISQTWGFMRLDECGIYTSPEWCSLSSMPPDPYDPLTANPDDGSVILCWRNFRESGQHYWYSVSREKRAVDREFELIATIDQADFNGRTIQYIDKGLEPGFFYCYTLQAITEVGDQSGESDMECIKK